MVISMNFLRNLNFPRCDFDQVLICKDSGTFQQAIIESQNGKGWKGP